MSLNDALISWDKVILLLKGKLTRFLKVLLKHVVISHWIGIPDRKNCIDILYWYGNISHGFPKEPKRKENIFMSANAVESQTCTSKITIHAVALNQHIQQLTTYLDFGFLLITLRLTLDSATRSKNSSDHLK